MPLTNAPVPPVRSSRADGGKIPDTPGNKAPAQREVVPVRSAQPGMTALWRRKAAGEGATIEDTMRMYTKE